MANLFFHRRLLLLITTASLSFISAAQTPAPSSPPSQPSLPTRPPPKIQDGQFIRIIDALIGAGEFSGWANNILYTTDPSSLPLTATFFIPTNAAVFNMSTATMRPEVFLDPFLVPYHIVPQRLTFPDLRRFSNRTRLPTLLPSKYVVVTNNSPSNFTIDDSRIISPNIYVNGAFAVHGIDNVMNYTVFSVDEVLPPPSVNTKPTPKHQSPPKGREPEFPSEEITFGLSDGAFCMCNWFLMIGFVGFAVLISRLFEI